MAAAALAGCVQKLDPIYIAEGLDAAPPASITILPVVDARAAKLDHVLVVRDVQGALVQALTAKGYAVREPEDLAMARRAVVEDLASMTPAQLCELAPEDAGVFLLVSVEAVEPEDSDLGPQLRVSLSGSLVDRGKRELLWRDRTSATNELSGLITMFALASIRHDAAVNAVRNLLSTLPGAGPRN